MPALSTYQSVQENFFVELNIDGTYTRFSDYDIAYIIDGVSYNALGSLLGITNTSSELRASNQMLSVSISGIPASNLALVNNADIKGSTLTVRRALFNPTSAFLLGTTETNPTIKFKGIVTNYGIKETWGSTSTFSLSLEVQSIIGQLLQTPAGRRTNPNDEKKFFPSDVAMDRVPTIRNSNYNFGAPDTMPKLGTT